MCLDLPHLTSAVFTVWRPDMKEAPRVRAFIDFLPPHFAGVRRALEEKGRLMQAEARKAVAEARARAAAVEV
jgi:hypothetical protein